MRKIVLLSVLLLVALVPAAWAAGNSILALQVGHGQGNFSSPFGDSYLGLSTDNSSQIKVGAEYWYKFKPDYAFTAAFEYGFYQETDASAVAGNEDIKYSTSSYHIRVGGDRLGGIGDRFTWFMGPGIDYWNGKSKYEMGAESEETPSVTRFGLNGRVGGIMQLGESVGLMGRVGGYFGYASADDNGAKVTFWPSGFEAMWGLTFKF